MPNAPGRDNGTRDNFVASNSETFNEDSFNVRIDGRLGAGTNTFGRYSRGKFLRDGPTAFGAGGGHGLVSLGGVSDSRTRASRTASTTRFRAPCLPTSASASSATTSMFFRSTSGRRRRPTRGFPVSILTRPSRRGCRMAIPAGRPRLQVRSRAWTPTAVTVRSSRTSTSSSSSATSRSCSAATRSRSGLDVRRAHNLRVPSDAHRSGRT